MRNVPLINVDIVPAGTQGIKVNVSDRVLSMKYEDNEEKADRVTLYFENEDLRNFDEPLFRQGSTMILSWGYADAMTVERLVVIRRISGFRQLAVEGVGGELAMDRVQQMRTWENATHSEIVRQIANEWGFVEERVLHIQKTTERYASTQQGKWTDAQFIRRLSKQNRMVWYIDFEGFHFHDQLIGEPPIKTYYYRGEMITEILDIAVEVDVTRVPGSIVGVTYAPELGTRIRFNAIHWDQEQKQQMAEWRENAGDYDKHIPGMADSAHASTLRVNADSLAKVKDAANKALAAAQKEVVKLRMSVMGDPNVFAKSVIEIQGIGKRMSQRYYVKNVVHSIGPGGYITELECISDGTGGLTKSRFMPEATRIQMMENTGKKPKPSNGEDKKGPRIRVSPEARRQMIEHTIAGTEAEEQRSIGPAEAEEIVDKQLQEQAERENQPAVIPAPAPQPVLSNAPPVTAIGQGNINLERRPYVDNLNGTYSTVRSMHFKNSEDEGGIDYLIPTTSEDGRLLTKEESITQFRKSGKHYGAFRNRDETISYQVWLLDQQRKYPPVNTIGDTPLESGANPDLEPIMTQPPPIPGQ